MLPISGMIRYFVATVVLPTRVGMIPCFLEQEECSPPRWGRVHAVRMSAGCVRIGDGFAHVAETQNAAPARDAMSGWWQLWLGADDLDEGRGHVNPEPCY